jgi:hypothetical protein
MDRSSKVGRSQRIRGISIAMRVGGVDSESGGGRGGRSRLGHRATVSP